jgi:hypothetical protein
MRKIESEREARAFLKAAKSAGVSLKEWARAHGIDGRSLHAWQMNLGRSRRPRLIELVPSSSAIATARYIVKIAETTIEVGDDFREETLVRIVRALRSC